MPDPAAASTMKYDVFILAEGRLEHSRSFSSRRGELILGLRNFYSYRYLYADVETMKLLLFSGKI